MLRKRRLSCGSWGWWSEFCIDNVYTKQYFVEMVYTSVLAPHQVAPSDAKGSINLRIEAQTRKLIDDAAAILGKTRTEFMVETARREAIDVLLDQRLFVLNAEQFSAFSDALDNPAAPGPKLRALLNRTPCGIARIDFA